jgi:hypothetical protein
MRFLRKERGQAQDLRREPTPTRFQYASFHVGEA